jgi:hypothetical protein
MNGESTGTIGKDGCMASAESTVEGSQSSAYFRGPLPSNATLFESGDVHGCGLLPSIRIVDRAAITDADANSSALIVHDISIEVGGLPSSPIVLAPMVPRRRAAIRKALLAANERGTTVEIGSVEMYTADLRTWDSRYLGSEYSHEMQFLMGPLFFDTGDGYRPVSPRVSRLFAPERPPCLDALLVGIVRLDPEWRGFGWGRWAMANAIIERSLPGCIAVATPAPVEIPGQSPGTWPRPTWRGWNRAVAGIASNLRRIGFRSIGDGEMILDTESRTTVERLNRWANSTTKRGSLMRVPWAPAAR